MKIRGLIFAVFMLPVLCGPIAAADDLANLDWSVQYLIDQSQTVLGVNQSDRPRDNRGLAISPDNRYLYAGYNNPSSGYCVRKIDLTQSDYTDATVAGLAGVSRGKAIDVDDVGRVYLSEGTNVRIYNADLDTQLYSISIGSGALEGVALARDAGQLYMYSSNRNAGTLTRYAIAETEGSITGHSIDASWGTSGVVTLSAEVRGVAVDSAGRAWVADNNDGAVYVVAADGSGYDTIAGVSSAMDIAFYGDTAMVSRYGAKTISLFDAGTLDPAGLLAPPLADLELRDSDGALSGLVAIEGVGFYVAGEGINTADEKSTYGRDDAYSGYIGDKYYTDLSHDDNDPILFAKVVPEPGTLALLAFAGLAALAALRFRKR